MASPCTRSREAFEQRGKWLERLLPLYAMSTHAKAILRKTDPDYRMSYLFANQKKKAELHRVTPGYFMQFFASLGH